MVSIYKAEKIGPGDWTCETLEIHPVTRKPYPVTQVYPDFGHPVEYADRIFPEVLAATWTRAGDGLEVTMEVRTTADNGPVAYGFSVVSRDGLRGIKDYRLPIPTMAVRAAKGHGFARGVPTIRKGKPLRGDEARMKRLQIVTDAYLEAHELNTPKAAYIAKVLDGCFESVSRYRIYHLIQDAKDEGLLPRKESK